jgi:pimeloyl-ACP methyl ester carboxylesterase
MRIWGFLLLLLSAPMAATAATGPGSFEGFVPVGEGEKLFVRYEAAAPGEPTLVLLNGLTYSTNQWGAFASALTRIRPGVGILRYDMKGMGRSLLEGPLPVRYEITYQEQAAQLKDLLDYLRLKKVELVGLSYGGAIAMEFASRFPARTARLFLMAPFTERLETQDQIIRLQVAATRLANPLNPATDAELYDFFLRSFIYTTYPQSEPTIIENPYKLEAVFRMVQSVRFFEARKVVAKLPEGSVHLMVANQDQYVPGETLEGFWRGLPASVRGSRLNISYTEHKIPEAIPGYSAAWILEVLGNQAISGGKVFEGTNWNFRAKNAKDGSVIELPRP